MKAKVSVGTCKIFVLGMDLTCPLCKTLVKSGEHHECRDMGKAKVISRKAARGKS